MLELVSYHQTETYFNMGVKCEGLSRHQLQTEATIFVHCVISFIIVAFFEWHGIPKKRFIPNNK